MVELTPAGDSMTRALPALALSFSLVLSGCYVTRDLSGPVPPPNTRVLAHLSPEGVQAMAVWIGEDAVAVEGVAGPVRGGSWELSLRRVEHQGGRIASWKGERVHVSEDAFTSIVERRLHRTRTALFVVGTATGVVVLARILGD
jgi:hypothetical protein